MELAERHAGGRVVSVLEGGYDLEGLARSAAAHVGALMGEARELSRAALLYPSRLSVDTISMPKPDRPT